MSLGRGKLAEGIKVVNAFRAERVGSVTVYYNGYNITTTAGTGIDTMGFDDVQFHLNIGTCAGAVATALNYVYESATDNPNVATLVTSASFDAIATASDETDQEISIRCKDTKRYLWLVSDFKGSPLTIDFAACAILGTPKSQATSQTLVQDLP